MAFLNKVARGASATARPAYFAALDDSVNPMRATFAEGDFEATWATRVSTRNRYTN